jgi:hypothetical protein
MNNDLTLEGLTPYTMSEDALIDMIQDHLIAWAREEAQANKRSFSICYEDTRQTFLDALQEKV